MKTLEEEFGLDDEKEIPFKRLDIAFVTFTHTGISSIKNLVVADEIEKNFKEHFYDLLFRCIWHGYRIKHHRIHILPAPEPEEIIWKKLGTPAKEQLFRIIINWVITLAILGVCLVVNIFISGLNVFFF